MEWNVYDEPLLRLIYGPRPSREAVVKAKAGLWVDPDCEDPRYVNISDRGTHPMFTEAGSAYVPVPCRRCKRCLMHKARMWYARALHELSVAERTWFVTLTFRRDPPLGYKEVQTWLRSVRRVGVAFRFMAVQERGEKGDRIHWHVLMHCAGTVRKRDVVLWPHGFSQMKLIGPAARDDAAGYLAQYASKSMLKVHASVRYGRH